MRLCTRQMYKLYYKKEILKKIFTINSTLVKIKVGGLAMPLHSPFKSYHTCIS